MIVIMPMPAIRVVIMVMPVIGLVAALIFSMVVIVTVVRMMVRMPMHTFIGLERRRHLDALEPVLRH